MRVILFSAALTLFTPYLLFAQKDSVQIFKVWRTGINYKSYIIANNDLFALNDSGKLVIWDLTKLDTIHFAHNNSLLHYTAIAKDRNNNVFLGTSKGQIFKIIPENLTYSLYLKTKYTIRYICFNSSNRLFLIVNNAVYDPITKQYWDKFENHSSGLRVTKKSFLFFKKTLSKYFAMPQYTFLDNQGKWWMTAVYGEFGGRTGNF